MPDDLTEESQGQRAEGDVADGREAGRPGTRRGRARGVAQKGHHAVAGRLYPFQNVPPVLQPRPREAEWFAPSHRAARWRGWDKLKGCDRVAKYVSFVTGPLVSRRCWVACPCYVWNPV